MPVLPAASTTRTFSVLLPVSVALSDQVLVPTVAVAVVQCAPLSSETSTCSSDARLALSVPLMLCAAVWVTRSVLDAPVSAEKATLAFVVVGGVVSAPWTLVTATLSINTDWKLLALLSTTIFSFVISVIPLNVTVLSWLKVPLKSYAMSTVLLSTVLPFASRPVIVTLACWTPVP